jgi:hypothetical protein
VQAHTTTALREELRQKEEQFRQKMSVLEQELTRFMDSSKGASQEEMARVQMHYEQKLLRAREDLREREGMLEKARVQNAELTRELVEATNESGQAKNEVRVLRDRLKKAAQDLQAAEDLLGLKDQEIQE